MLATDHCRRHHPAVYALLGGACFDSHNAAGDALVALDHPDVRAELEGPMYDAMCDVVRRKLVGLDAAARLVDAVLASLADTAPAEELEQGCRDVDEAYVDVLDPDDACRSCGADATGDGATRGLCASCAAVPLG